MLSTFNAIVNTNCTSLLVFEYVADFKLHNDESLEVYYVAVDLSETLLNPDTEYTVKAMTDTGFKIVLVTSYDTGLISIRRKTELNQESDFVSGNDFPADLFEKSLDKLTMLSQEIKEDVDRSIKTTVIEEPSDLTLPGKTDRASKFLYFDVNGDVQAVVGTDGAGAVIAANVPIVDAGSLYSASNVEDALQEVAGDLDVLTAADVAVVDAGGLYVATDVENCLQEAIPAVSSEYDIATVDVIKTLPVLTGIYQIYEASWINGDGTAKIQFSVPDNASTPVYTTSVYEGEGEGHIKFKAVNGVSGLMWKVLEYEDSGSNINGSWERHLKQQIVRTIETSSLITNSAVGNIYSSATTILTLPKIFKTGYKVVTQASPTTGRFWCDFANETTTSTIILRALGSSISSAGTISAMCYGPWV